jgi:hypothetical protein
MTRRSWRWCRRREGRTHREGEPGRQGRTVDGRDHRLVEVAARNAFVEPGPTEPDGDAGLDLAQIGAGAERTSVTGEHRDAASGSASVGERRCSTLTMSTERACALPAGR